MKPYTVLLLRPDYAADNFGQDTYLAHVNAPDIKQAQKLARVEVMTEDQDGDEFDPNDLEDYAVLAVFEGHLNDLSL